MGGWLGRWGGWGEFTLPHSDSLPHMQPLVVTCLYMCCTLPRTSWKVSCPSTASMSAPMGVASVSFISTSACDIHDNRLSNMCCRPCNSSCATASASLLGPEGMGNNRQREQQEVDRGSNKRVKIATITQHNKKEIISAIKNNNTTTNKCGCRKLCRKKGYAEKRKTS